MLAQIAWGTFFVHVQIGNCFRVGQSVFARMVCVLFSLTPQCKKNKQARVLFHKPQNCIFDAYIHCCKNADLIFSFVMQ